MVDASLLADPLPTNGKDPGVVSVAGEYHSGIWRIGRDAIRLDRAFCHWTTASGAVVMMQPERSLVRRFLFGGSLEGDSHPPTVA